MTEDKMVRWHHRLNGHEFEQTLGGSEGQGHLVCCSPWGRKETKLTEEHSRMRRENQRRIKCTQLIKAGAGFKAGSI